MGFATKIMGSIECQSDDVRQNVAAIETFDYSKTWWPFRNCFGTPKDAYRGAIIPIADIIKCDPDERIVWINEFEKLLFQMSFVIAEVFLISESGTPISVKYHGQLNRDRVISQLQYLHAPEHDATPTN